MKKVILYKYFNPNNLFGGYGWSITDICDTWDHIYSDPYYVEIPDDFYVGQTVMGNMMFFKNGCDKGYELTIGKNCENGKPYLVGGCPVEMIKLNVLGMVLENKR